VMRLFGGRCRIGSGGCVEISERWGVQYPEPRGGTGVATLSPASKVAVCE